MQQNRTIGTWLGTIKCEKGSGYLVDLKFQMSQQPERAFPKRKTKQNKTKNSPKLCFFELNKYNHSAPNQGDNSLQICSVHTTERCLISIRLAYCSPSCILKSSFTNVNLTLIIHLVQLLLPIGKNQVTDKAQRD